MKKSKSFIIKIILVNMCFFLNVSAETLKITTYYPSPYGVFNTVRLFPTDNIDPIIDACLEV